MTSKPWALITGGTSGIGLGIARKLGFNYNLALNFASNYERAQVALTELKGHLPDTNIVLLPRHLKLHSDADLLLQEMVEQTGHFPSVLVNSAGKIHDSLLLTADFSDFQSVVQEQLVVTMALTQKVLKNMYKEKWGRIINLSSISANYSKRGQSNYAAAKAGIEAFTRTTALEVAHRGITINCIAPGLIDTPMTKDFIQHLEQKGVALATRIPAGRMGRPDEVGALARFLCSKDADYITGTVIVIDGGRSLGDTSL